MVIYLNGRIKVIYRGLWIVVVVLCCTLSSKVQGQLVFVDRSDLLPSQGFSSWLQKGVTDMDGDGRDDIVRADRQGFFYILYQQPDGKFTSRALGSVQSSTPLSVVLADIDNNGHADILTGGEYTGVRSVMLSPTASRIIRLPEDSVFTQASALSDINNDGLLDAFVCNDDSTNAVWKNTPNGSFVRDNMGFAFTSLPPEKQAGNYGIVFADVDNDGDLDAYVSKCKAGVTDSTDARRINQLFINSGGIYTDRAKEYGLADSSQTWVTEFQDIDNDGDLDAFIANHHSPSRLMLNDGHGHFTDITAGAGLLGNTPDGLLQALMRDFDNDGYVDLLVSGLTDAKLFLNNGNRTFREVTLPLLVPKADTPLRSFAVGDLNHDGFLDLYCSYLFRTTEPDRLWLNTPNANHYMAIRLVGTESNRSGVGARIKLTTKDRRILVREVRAGESYGISNSLTQYVGLGAIGTVEKVEVLWPSGHKSEVLTPPIDELLTLTEPTCQKQLCVPIKTTIKK